MYLSPTRELRKLSLREIQFNVIREQNQRLNLDLRGSKHVCLLVPTAASWNTVMLCATSFYPILYQIIKKTSFSRSWVKTFLSHVFEEFHEILFASAKVRLNVEFCIQD